MANDRELRERRARAFRLGNDLLGLRKEAAQLSALGDELGVDAQFLSRVAELDAGFEEMQLRLARLRLRRPSV